jgi:chitinase
MARSAEMGLHGRVSANRHRRPRRRLAVLLALILGSGLLSAAPARPALAVGVDAGILPRADIHGVLTHEVYGYLPYWRLDADAASRLNYDLLSTIAFFGLGIKATGDIDMAWRGTTAYLSANAVAVTNAAHAKGVRVVPTFQLFDSGSLPKMTAFLGSTVAQDRFIAQALDLMARRSADGANFDFEPMSATSTPGYLAFLRRFRTGMLARFPGAELVNATSAGAPSSLITGLVPIVSKQFVMTYNYRWSGSTVTGAIAPLDHASRNVQIHIRRFMAYAPASSLILGVPYYGYDWPVTSTVPNATVRADKTRYGAVSSVTYASARAFLAAHPGVVRNYDVLEGSSFYTYWDATHGTYRQVYFEDERSAAAKYDYAITTGLGGVGIWTLGNDGSYPQMWDALRVFYNPVHQVFIGSRIRSTDVANGVAYGNLSFSLRNAGNITEHGAITWIARNSDHRPVAHGTIKATAILGAQRGLNGTARIRLGLAATIPSGVWSVEVSFTTAHSVFRSARTLFLQPY